MDAGAISQGIFEEEIRWGDRSGTDGKKGAMISTTETIAFRLKEARTEVFRRLYLNPLKQFGE
jgi:hypothetical protein